MISLKNKKGQGAVEYAMIVLAIIGIIAAVLFGSGAFKTSINKAFTDAQAKIDTR